MSRKQWLVLLGVVAATSVLVPAAGSKTKPTRSPATVVDTAVVDDTIRNGVLSVSLDSTPATQTLSRSQVAAGYTRVIGAAHVKRALGAGTHSAASARFRTTALPAVGDVRNWLSLDDTYGTYFRKGFMLRGIGQHVEVWVASELNRRAPNLTAFPEVGRSDGTQFMNGDCRNGPRTVVTDEQVNYLIGQFDNNIWPKEADAFSIAPDRDGSNNLLEAVFGPPGPATFDPSGDGAKTVVLVDNVRDDNFYDLNNTQGFSYIAGFFSGQLNAIFDRNVMTIDAFDWLHRTGATPPNDPVPGDLCNSAPARPFLYEGVFAHEYQHLLESYEDPDEVNWVNEGLSDWAQSLTGYVKPATPITESGFDSHIQCFLGHLGELTPANPNPRAGGPENSLTRWGDKGDDHILCDYGAAYSMMEFLDGRYGDSFMSALHRGDANGLAGLQEALDALHKRKVLAQDVVHDWALMVALDGWIDDGAKLSGRVQERDVTTPTLHASINFDTPEAYASPGAPSNGSDYVLLRDASGNPVSGRDIDSVAFKGVTTLPPKPVQWTVDPNPPGHAGNAALYSGTGDNRDESIVKQVAVPSGVDASLSFAARWNLEDGYDFAFVQVSTDGGGTYTSVACTDTTTTNIAPDAIASVAENLPGLNGDSAGWLAETCSLSAYQGQTVLLAFRTINDPAVQGSDPATPAGFWVDDVTVGSSVDDGSSLTGWQSPTQIRPTSVANYNVTLISVRAGSHKTEIKVKRLKLDSSFATKNRRDADRYIDEHADSVYAIVTYDDPTETVDQYAPYMLTVNNVLQPGGV
jgi:hypothetical protein